MACIDYAFNTYIRRSNIDTNPRIVKVIPPVGRVFNHWYYRSDQVIATSGWVGIECTYEGPINQLPDILREEFAKHSFGIDEKYTQLAEQTKKENCKSWNEFFGTPF